MESDRIERTESTTNIDKFSEAICAFANDYPNHQKAGYLLIGLKDNGELSGLKATDALLKNLAAIRHNGQILPQPAMSVHVESFEKGDIIVIEVQPAFMPPVRYKGKLCIRVGPTKAIANETEERRLIEKRASNMQTFDAWPCIGASLKELSIDLFKLTYLPTAIDEETLIVNNRDLRQQLASLRLYELRYDCPTNAGILLLTPNAKLHFPGAYVQYVKFEGTTMTSKVLAEKVFSGTLIDVLKNLSNFLEFNVVAERPVKGEGFAEKTVSNYPYWSLRELTMNAVMHRDYASNTPIYIYEFADKIEIHNAGSLYGNARPDNFPNTSDYRNPIIAEAMKNLKHVNRFNYGVKRAQELLFENGNPPAEFKTDSPVNFVVTIRINKQW